MLGKNELENIVNKPLLSLKNTSCFDPKSIRICLSNNCIREMIPFTFNFVSFLDCSEILKIVIDGTIHDYH